MTEDGGGPKGVCPHCEITRGEVGGPCPEAGCSRKSYRLIPVEWFDAATAYAARRQRPLDPLLGRCIERYLLAGKLGEGGMGAVYLALQQPLMREVALKLISGLDLTQTTISRFEREARAISVLDHPNIVKLHDYGIGEIDFRAPFMALEYVRHGRTLRRALEHVRADTGGPIPAAVILRIFQQILHALGTAHDLGIIHRDMKPDNVMVAAVRGNPQFVKILDFGLAKAVSEMSGFDGDVSRTGHFLGTPHYMAPEQAPRRGRPVVDARCDLYAVAVMLFEIFTGVRPFEGETPLEVLSKKVDPDHHPCGFAEARALPRPLRALLEKGMAASTADRFAAAGEMLEALERALAARTLTVAGLPPAGGGSSDERPATPPGPGEAQPPVAPPDSPDRAGPPPDPTRPFGTDPPPARPPAQRAGRWSVAPDGASEARGGVSPGTCAPGEGPPPRPVAAGGCPQGGALPLSGDTGRTEDALPRQRRKVPAAWFAGPVAGLAVVAALYLALAGRPETPQASASSTVQGSADPVAAEIPPSVEAVPAPVPAPAAGIPPPGPAAVPPATGSLGVRFESTPPGATVLDGARVLGRTPFEADLAGSPGMRELVFRLAGHLEVRVVRDVRPGAVVTATLQPVSSSVPKRSPRPRRPDDYKLID